MKYNCDSCCEDFESKADLSNAEDNQYCLKCIDQSIHEFRLEIEEANQEMVIWEEKRRIVCAL